MNISLFLSNPILWLTNEKTSRILAFHAILALLSLFSNIFFIGWFYFLVFSFLKLRKSQKKILLPYFFAYLVPLEVFSRMLQCSPFIPDEGIKYTAVMLLIYGILIMGSNKYTNKTGTFILLLSLPSFIFIPPSYYNFRYYLISSYLGFFVVTLSITYFSKLKLPSDNIRLIFKILFFSSLLIVIYSLFTGKFSRIDELTVEASGKFTGGFGSNQVGSINGFCFGVIFFFALFKIKIFSSKLITNLFVLITFIISVLSFTRASIITPIITILLCFIKYNKSIKFKSKLRLLYGLFFIVLSFFFLNTFTNNSLLERYSGETKATLEGKKFKTINSISNGRTNIATSDLEMWMDNIIFGLGPGQSIPNRINYGFNTEIAPHFEFTRLLSEHGIFGLLIVLIILYHGFKLFNNKQINPNIHLFLIFSFAFGLLYTSHSATRTILPAFLLGFSFLNVTKK